MALSTDYHAEPGDKFSVNVRELEGQVYAVIGIENPRTLDPVTIYTPHGLNWTTDYLSELRDALNGAIAELVQMEKNWELAQVEHKEAHDGRTN